MTLAAHTLFARKLAGPNALAKLGVGVVIHDWAGRILLERRSDCVLRGGGGMEPGGSLIPRAEREVWEENGQKIRLCGPIGGYAQSCRRIFIYSYNGVVRHLVDTMAQEKRLGGDLRLSQESLEHKYFHVRSIPEDLAPPAWPSWADAAACSTGML